ncbi:MAG: glycoside hydrolase family 88 protein [Asticcacaulis sp.]
MKELDRRLFVWGGITLAATLPVMAAPRVVPDVQTAAVLRRLTLKAGTRQMLDRVSPHMADFVGNYLRTRQANPAIWNYEDGLIWKGALDLKAVTDDPAFVRFVKADLKTRVLPSGALAIFKPADFNIDGINSGKVLEPMWQLTQQARYRTAMDAQFAQLVTHPRTSDGNYWHKLIYPHQVWLDGVYMAHPFQVAYGRVTERPELFADTVRQCLGVERRMKRGDGLYVHGYDESRQERWADPVTGHSPHIWGRAMGWWSAALVDIYEQSAGMDEGRRAEIARLTRETLTALLQHRSANGLWYQVVDQGLREGNYEEASASLMISYALMKAGRLGIAEFSADGKAAFKACVDQFLTPQALNGICGVAGLGNRPYRDGSYDYYISEPITPNDPKGVGPLMWATTERLRA